MLSEYFSSTAVALVKADLFLSSFAVHYGRCNIGLNQIAGELQFGHSNLAPTTSSAIIVTVIIPGEL
jgi:hypothetical protein